MAQGVPTVRTISFGAFRLMPSRRLLLEGEKPVQLGSRALEILIAITERPGELLGKDELLTRAWPGLHVVEGNLKFQMATLRRALGDGREGRRFIEASPGQGYRFVADVTVDESADSEMVQPVRAVERNHNLPVRLGSLVGRHELITKLVERRGRQRLLTIVGPGGIGKTSVAIALAQQLTRAYPDGVWLADLARVADQGKVPASIAAVLEIKGDPENLIATLVEALQDKRMLIVLDNCAHVIEAAARLAGSILRGAPGIDILATSREPLQVEGEHVQRLQPLESPPQSASIDAGTAMRFPAVQLFGERASEQSDFTLRDQDAPAVSEICRKLDGIPLAIELAAARVGTLGIHGLLARLDDRMTLLSGGRRTAVPHHRTLRATIDWSYDLLAAPEQKLFMRLAVFAGGFTLGACAAVAGDADRAAGEVDHLLFALADKSLVIADSGSEEPRFRLLDTTRLYALERLAETGDRDVIFRLHATYFAELLESASGRVADGKIAFEIDNVRAALRWAFGPQGDPALGVRLAAAAVPLWMALSLLVHDQGWVEKAIAALEQTGLKGTREEMILQEALGNALQFAKGATADGHRALDRALELARMLGDIEDEMRTTHVKWLCHIRVGEIRAALALAEAAKSSAASTSNEGAKQTAERMLGISLVYAGQLAAASKQLTYMQSPDPGTRLSYDRRFGYDQWIIGHLQRAFLYFLQGFPEQAARTAEQAIGEARAVRDDAMLCVALRWAGCTLALRLGDLEACRRYAEELVEVSAKCSLAEYRAFGTAVEAILNLKSGVSRKTIEQVRQALAYWRESRWHIYLMVDDFAEILAKAGYLEEISVLNDEALDRAEQNQELWTMAELLRLKGELALLSGAPARSSKAWFDRALAVARAQGALAWELRTTTSIARLRAKQGQTEQARTLLQCVYGRFTEGFDTADLKEARKLLNELGGAPGKPRAHRRAARRRPLHTSN